MPSLLALGMAVVVGSALGFQYIGGYIPCALCLMQRQPYYYGIPVAILGALSAAARPADLDRPARCLLVGRHHDAGRRRHRRLSRRRRMAFLGRPDDLLDHGHRSHDAMPATCSATSTPCMARPARMRRCACSVCRLAGWNVIASLILAAIALHRRPQGRRKQPKTAAGPDRNAQGCSSVSQ